ncbi:MAG: hypothetical protein MJZ85_11225 [Bacteroidales bacterium]|nr:hypothetical protein [Bacteroidales bacterium]
MDDNFRKRLDAIHDVRCPICGTKADWVQTSENDYETLTCCHEELMKIINDRSDQLVSAVRGQQQKTVKIGGGR